MRYELILKSLSMEKTQNGPIIHEVTPLSERDCFYIADRKKKRFTYPIHNHKEFELNFTQNAAGVKRTVGDNSEVIGDYDLVLITGEELEHVWEQNTCESDEIREITIQFKWDFNDGTFFSRTQFDSIRRMVEQARKGLAFPMSAIMKVYNKLDTLANEENGFQSVITFLTILYELSLCEDARTLSSTSFAKVTVQSDSRRILKVQQYVNDNFRKEIRLSDLAALVQMSPTAFSRFFKLHTGKNFSDYIIDIRLGHATRMLVDTTQSVAEICYGCGFNNLSNFNRIFKKYKQCSPKEFREQYYKKKVII